MDNIDIKFDEREMLFQRVDVINMVTKEPRRSFYVARHFGVRDVWVESSILNAKVVKIAFTNDGGRGVIFREAQTPCGKRIDIVSVDWLLKFDNEPDIRDFLLACENAFGPDVKEGGTMYVGQ